MTLRRYAACWEVVAKEPPMPPTVPVVALVIVVVLSLIAKERKYAMTGSALVVLAGVLTMWFVTLFFKFG